MDQKKIRGFEQMWVLTVPRIARELTSFAQAVRWLIGVARDACKPPARNEPEVELATEWRCQPREEPEPWARLTMERPRAQAVGSLLGDHLPAELSRQRLVMVMRSLKVKVASRPRDITSPVR